MTVCDNKSLIIYNNCNFSKKKDYQQGDALLLTLRHSSQFSRILLNFCPPPIRHSSQFSKKLFNFCKINMDKNPFQIFSSLSLSLSLILLNILLNLKFNYSNIISNILKNTFFVIVELALIYFYSLTCVNNLLI